MLYWYGILMSPNDTNWSKLGSYDLDEAKIMLNEIIETHKDNKEIKPHIVIIDMSKDEVKCVGTVFSV